MTTYTRKPPGSSGGYRHETFHDPDEMSMCPGYRLVEIGRYTKLVACDDEHAHQGVLCIRPDGSRGREPLDAPHRHGDEWWYPWSPDHRRRLNTESEARAVHAKRILREEHGPTGAPALRLALEDFRKKHGRDPHGLTQLGKILPTVGEVFEQARKEPEPRAEPPDDGIPF